MKHFNLSEQVSSEASRDAGGKKTPDPGSALYIPNYHGVNQVLWKAGGDGAIAFGDALAAESNKKFQHYMAMEITSQGSDALIDMNAQMNRESKEYLRNHPDGKGYTEAMTGKYKELRDTAVQNAATDEVREYIQLHSQKGLDDWGNKAFAAEDKLFAGSEFGKFEKKQAIYLNNIRINPELWESLTPQYMSLVENMRNICPLEYEKLKTEAVEKWAVSYVEGRIDKNPHQALDMLKKGTLGKELSPHSLDSLLKRAQGAIEHNEYMSWKRENHQNTIHNRSASECMTNVKHVAIFSTGNPQEIIDDAYRDGIFSNQERQEAEIWVKEHRLAERKKEEEKSILDECVRNKTPPPLSISTKTRNEHFYEYIDALNAKRSGEIVDGKPGKPVSMTVIVEYAKDYAMVYNAGIDPLKHAIVNNIKNGKDAAGIMDTCIAISGEEHVPAIEGIDKECVDFANMAVVMFKGKKNLSEIIEERNEYFKVDKNLYEYREKLWKETDYQKEPIKALDTFYRNHGYKGWFKDINPVNQELLDAKVLGIAERVYNRTGSVTKAENVVSVYLNGLLKETRVNGERELMINPPSSENTGFSNSQIGQIIDKVAADILHDLEKSGRKVSISAAKREGWFFINGEKSRRKIYYEGIDINGVKGNLYYLLNKQDPGSKEYLINPKTGQRVLVDFDKIKGISFDKLMEN